MTLSKNSKLFLIIKVCIIISMFLVGFILWDKLPNVMPTHWNFKGQPDSYSSKIFAVSLLPAISIIMIMMFALLPKIDPRKDKYEKFTNVWEIFQITILMFFAYIYFVSLYISMHPQVSINTFMLVGIGVFFIIIGNYLGKVRSNYFVGVKTPRTIENEEVWNKTHRLSGILFVLGGMAFLITTFFQKYIIFVFVGVVALCTIFPIFYSYWIFKTIYSKKKFN